MTEPRILVADDSSTVRTQVSQILSKAGYGVATANDGAEAVHLAQRVLPTMMVLDINMPTLDGFGVCLELRRMGAPWSEIPIVFLTSTASHALEILGEEMGGYLRKPVREDELLNAVRSVMTESRVESGESSARTNSRHLDSSGSRLSALGSRLFS